MATRIYKNDKDGAGKSYSEHIRTCVEVRVLGNTNLELQQRSTPVSRELQRFLLYGIISWKEVLEDLKSVHVTSGGTVSCVRLRVYTKDCLPEGAPYAGFRQISGIIGFCYDLPQPSQ